MAGVALEQIKADDVRELVRHPDPQQRATAAQRICHSIRRGGLSQQEKAFAHKLLNYIADDAVAIVRRTLAITLKNSPELPRDIAMKLAADIDNIAIPVLTYSPVLTEQDLIDVLRSKAASKIMAVARRSAVSGTVVREIVRYGDSRAVAEVAANDGAIIDAKTASMMLDMYNDDDLIKEAFISRRDLPIQVMEKLITLVSEEAALVMHHRHEVPIDMAVDLATRARERAVLDIIDIDTPAREIQLFVARMYREGRLTPSFLIRAAGLGHMALLKYCLAKLADVSPSKASVMIHDGGPFGLKAICAQAGLTLPHTKVLRAACAIFRDLEISGVEFDHYYFQSLMIERILTLPLDLSGEDELWFLERLDGLERQAA